MTTSPLDKEVRHVNPHSDFPLYYTVRDPRGEVLPLCDIPFSLRLYSRHAVSFRAWHDSEGWHNCRPVTDDEDYPRGTILVTVANHNLGCGPVSAELHYYLPDDRFQSGCRRVCDRQKLPLVITDEATDAPAAIDIEAVLPMAVMTAYDTARAAGFDGTAEEYYAGLSALPALSATVSDLAAAKAEVAAALRLHGVDAADGDSLSSMAAKVAALRLAVPSQPGVVAHDWNGVPCPDPVSYTHLTLPTT